MSQVLIRRAMEKRLAAMFPALPTAYESANFTPISGQPYQRVYLMPNRTITKDTALTSQEKKGIFQVSLYYPLGMGPNAAELRAESIRLHFHAGLEMLEGGVRVRVDEWPTIEKGGPDGDRYALPVSIYYRVFTK